LRAIELRIPIPSNSLAFLLASYCADDTGCVLAADEAFFAQGAGCLARCVVNETECANGTTPMASSCPPIADCSALGDCGSCTSDAACVWLDFGNSSFFTPGQGACWNASVTPYPDNALEVTVRDEHEP